MIINKIVETVSRFFYPSNCFICHSPLNNGEFFVCERCDDGKKRLLEFKKSDYRLTVLDRVWTLGDYNSILGEALKEFKYNRDFNALKYVFNRIENSVDTLELNGDQALVTPVPLFWKKHLLRGFNQSGYYAKKISHVLGLKSMNALLRKKNTKTQTRLGGRLRRENVKDAFALKNERNARGRSFLLVDDVITTGATSNECAYVLKKNGADFVGLFALCGA